MKNLLGWLMVVALAGCGHKGPIQPLSKGLPAAPKALVAAQQGERVRLSWLAPEAGEGAGTEASFSVEKAIFEPENDCATCEDQYRQIAQLQPDYLRGARRVGDRYYVWDPALVPGKLYRYRVTTVSSTGLIGGQASVKLIGQQPPQAPARIEGIPRDHHVQLNWSEVKTAVGYNLYRRKGDAPYGPAPVNLKPIPALTYTDYETENDQPYTYGVRAVVPVGNHLVESPLSEAVTLTPRRGQ